MKKIGILTFQKAHNYGAILQCYALQEFLLSAGYEVKIIDYTPKWMIKGYGYLNYRLYNPLHPKSAIQNILALTKRINRYKSFDKFINTYLILSDKKRLNLIYEDFDIVIIGSDQVWNPKETKQYDSFYWGNFKHEGKPYIISYAASMGGAVQSANWSIINEYLKNFNLISVREKYLAMEIYKRCKRQAKWVIDPTLLHTSDFWIKKATPIKIKEPYLFFYQARANKEAVEYAQNVAKRLNLKFIAMSAYILSINSKESIKANPFDFLGLINKASYVITTSFHATVFCIQFKKQFISLKLNDGEDGRSATLLNLMKLQDRQRDLKQDITMKDIDWTKAINNLEPIVNESKRFLYDAIK